MLDGPGPKPLPDPREVAIENFKQAVRKTINKRMGKITGVPDGQAPIPVNVVKAIKPRRKVTHEEVERAKEKLVEYARNAKPTLFEVIRKKLNEKISEGGLAEMEEVAEAYIANMKKPGGFQYFKEIFDREMGKVPDKIQNEITVVQPNLPLALDDFSRAANYREPGPEEDTKAGNN